MRSSATSSQIFVPISTIDWCISGLTCSPDSGERGGHQLADVRAQLARSRIDDLKFLFDANGEPVAHEDRLGDADSRERIGAYNTPLK